MNVCHCVLYIVLSVDAMDVSGSHQLDVSHNIKKKPLDQYGNPIGQEVTHGECRCDMWHGHG